MNSLRTSVVLAVVICFAMLRGTAVADPLLNQVLKFEQLPLNGGLAPSNGGALFAGHDELSTATLDATKIIPFYVGTYMADDFSDNFSTPVVHVQWWGSYLNAGGGGGVQKFLISFETDVPAVDGTVSHPGDPILSQIVNWGALSAGSGTFTELAIDTPLNAPEQLYQYNAELALPFEQLADEIYWLKIVALVDPQHDGPMQWGWHNRDYTIQDTLASPVPSPGEHMVPNALGIPIWHFQDNAVSGGVAVIPPPAFGTTLVAQDGFAPQNYVDGLDGPTGIGEFSKDLAFRLYTTPEPSTIVLLGMGSLALAVVIFRRRAV